jgi:hypothetical protein
MYMNLNCLYSLSLQKRETTLRELFKIDLKQTTATLIYKMEIRNENLSSHSVISEGYYTLD